MSSAEYSCKLFKPNFAYRQRVWTQIRLLLKQTTIVVIGSLWVNAYTNSDGTDQTAHLHIMTMAFVILRIRLTL